MASSGRSQGPEMKSVLTRTIALLFCAAFQLLAAEPRVPVLVELFTSEGCSSCPPADQLLSILDQKQPIAGAELIVISEHVDYWNQPTWGDPYSSALFSERQSQYAARWNTDDIYTPQLVIDGRWAMSGNKQSDIANAIRKSMSQAKTPMSFEAIRSGNQAHLKLHVDADAQHGKTALFLVLAADRVENHVPSGENAGRDLSHVAVAYSFARIATLKTSAAFDREWTVSIKPKFPILGGTRVIVFLQDQTTGQVVGAAQVRFAKTP